MCVLIFSKTLCEKFLIPRRIQGDAINVPKSSCIASVIFIKF